MHEESIHPKRIDRILYVDEAEHLLLANRGVAFLTKANALKLNGDRLVAKPLEKSASAWTNGSPHGRTINRGSSASSFVHL